MAEVDSKDKGYEADPYIHTPTGRFYMARPVWNVDNIAHALGQNARYNGNAREFYSVAEHGVLVSLLMEHLHIGDPFEGLHHDDTESVMSDIPSPWKPMLPDWRAIDKRLELSMRQHWGLPESMTDGCRTADWLALFMEAKILIDGGGADFYDPKNLRPQALALMKEKGWTIRRLPWKRAREVYLERHAQLLARRS